jgi:maltooligosyltrehalose trehalohydrolase
LTDGRLDRVQVRYDEEAGWLVVERGPITVVCNLGRSPVQVPVGGERVLLSSVEELAVLDGRVSLPADSVAILG